MYPILMKQVQVWPLFVVRFHIGKYINARWSIETKLRELYLFYTGMPVLTSLVFQAIEDQGSSLGPTSTPRS